MTPLRLRQGVELGVILSLELGLELELLTFLRSAFPIEPIAVRETSRSARSPADETVQDRSDGDEFGNDAF